MQVMIAEKERELVNQECNRVTEHAFRKPFVRQGQFRRVAYKSGAEYPLAAKIELSAHPGQVWQYADEGQLRSLDQNTSVFQNGMRLSGGVSIPLTCALRRVEFALAQQALGKGPIDGCL